MGRRSGLGLSEMRGSRGLMPRIEDVWLLFEWPVCVVLYLERRLLMRREGEELSEQEAFVCMPVLR